MLGVLKNRNFLLIWLAQLAAGLGEYFYWLAMPLTIYSLTGSTIAMSTAMISLALPALFIGPFAGVFVDRWDRRLTMIFSDLSRALVVLLCLTVKSPDQIWVFYVVGILQSTCGQFFFPARNAAVPLVVKKEELTTANGLLQVTMTFSMIIGAGLAGVAIETFGRDFAFIADSISFLIATLILFFIRVPRTTGRVADESHASQAIPLPTATVMAEMREGLSFLFASRTLLGILAATIVLNLGMGALNVVWVPYLRQTFDIGASGLGAVDAAQGIGMALGSLAVGYLARRFGMVPLIGAGLIWAGSMLILIGFSSVFALVLIWSGFIGLAIPLISAGLTTITQLVVPDLKRGRVSGIMGSLTNVATILSMVAAGLAGTVAPLAWVYVGSGIIIALSGLVSFRLIEEPAPPNAENAKSRSGESPASLSTARAGAADPESNLT